MNKYFTLLVLLGLFLTGCNETIPLGTGVLPDGDNPDNFFTDTTTIYSWTVREDSLRTDKLFLSQVGYKEDPIFGKLKCSLAMGFRSPGVGLNASLLDTVGGYSLDSIFLNLMVSDIYGDTNKRMSYTVYKLAEPLESESAYFSNASVSQSMIPIGGKQNFYASATVEYDEDTVYTSLGPQIRIPLLPFFGQSLLNILNSDQINSNELFRQYLPGVIIVPDEQAANIVEVDMVTNSVTSSRRTALEDTRIHMYFKNANGTPLDLIIPATVLTSGVNLYSHDYTATNVGSALASTAPQGDAVNYIEGLAGVKTKVTFPNVESFGEIAVLKAELVVTQINDGAHETFTPPERLFAVRVGEDGESLSITDFTDFPAGHSGGFFRETVLEGGEEVYRYRINISDYFQRLILGQEPNNGLYIAVNSTQSTDLLAINSSDLIPDRAVIGGGSNTDSQYRLKLELTYTRFD